MTDKMYVRRIGCRLVTIFVKSKGVLPHVTVTAYAHVSIDGDVIDEYERDYTRSMLTFWAIADNMMKYIPDPQSAIKGNCERGPVKHSLADWRYEVARCDTELGYDDWLEEMLEFDAEEYCADVDAESNSVVGQIAFDEGADITDGATDDEK